jgi:Uma2 family endonuclease
MATKPTTEFTYADLQAFPEDNLRRELIDGELIVTAAPTIRHQRVVTSLVAEIHSWTKRNGGVVLPAPTDVLFSDSSVVEPDVVCAKPAPTA